MYVPFPLRPLAFPELTSCPSAASLTPRVRDPSPRPPRLSSNPRPPSQMPPRSSTSSTPSRPSTSASPARTYVLLPPPSETHADDDRTGSLRVPRRLRVIVSCRLGLEEMPRKDFTRVVEEFWSNLMGGVKAAHATLVCSKSCRRWGVYRCLFFLLGEMARELEDTLRGSRLSFCESWKALLRRSDQLDKPNSRQSRVERDSSSPPGLSHPLRRRPFQLPRQNAESLLLLSCQRCVSLLLVSQAHRRGPAKHLLGRTSPNPPSTPLPSSPPLQPPPSPAMNPRSHRLSSSAPSSPSPSRSSK